MKSRKKAFFQFDLYPTNSPGGVGLWLPEWVITLIYPPKNAKYFFIITVEFFFYTFAILFIRIFVYIKYKN